MMRQIGQWYGEKTMATKQSDLIDLIVAVEKEKLIETMRVLLDRHPHSHILADVIINNLEKSPVGLAQLLNAFLGMKVECPYEEGQEVWVKYDALPTWRFSPAMQEKDMIFQGNIKAVIRNIDLYRLAPISVEYEYLNSNGDLEKGSYEVQMKQIQLIDNELELS